MGRDGSIGTLLAHASAHASTHASAQAGAQGGGQARAQDRADVSARVREAVERTREAQTRAQDAQRTAQQEVRAAQEDARAAVREAQAAAREARAISADAPDAPDAPGVPLPPPPTRIVVQDGHVLVDGGSGVGGGTMVSTTQMPFPPQDALPQGVLELSYAFFMMIAVIAIGVPLIKLASRWIERRGAMAPQVPADVTARLERIEQAVETVAVEVERIAEGQRFTSKLMAEMRQAPQLEAARIPAEPRR